MPLSGSAFWALLLPCEKTNLFTGPSAERGTANVEVASATIGSTSQFQQFGAWSYSMLFGAPTTAGAAFGSWSSGNGTAYTASMYFRGIAGSAYRMGIVDAATLTTFTGGTLDITGGGTWHRHSLSYTENVGQIQRLYVAKRSSANLDTVYLDGFQVEVGSLTTYLDGDQEGCYWLGIPHESQSTRSGTYRGGGSIVALADLGLKPYQDIGVGMSPQEITGQSFALLPGAEYQRSRSAERPFTISFDPIIGTTQQDYHITRRKIINALKPDLLDPQQPVRFWYTGGQGTVQIDAVYAGGLETGERNSPMTERGAIKFIAHDPYWYATTQEGTSLAGRTALGTTNFMAKRDPLGRWGTMGASGSTLQGVPNVSGLPDASGVIDATYNNGTLFFCGSFGTVAGTSYKNIAMYFPASNTFGTLDGGSIGTNNFGHPVRALYYAPWGSLYIGGDFVKAGGTVATSLAQWNGGGFGTLIGGTITVAGGGGTSVRSFDMLGGTLFFGGRFSDLGGTVAGSIGFWSSGGSFGTLSNGVTSLVREVAVGLDSALYAAGALGLANGTTVNTVARWDGNWGSMGTGFYGAGGAQGAIALAIEPNGKIIAVGQFQNSDNGTVYNAAEWNGKQWTGLGSGLFVNGAITSTWVTTAVADPLTGIVYAGGRFDTAGGIRMPDGAAVWNRYTWLPLDIDVSGVGTFNKFVLAPDRTLFALGTFQGTAQAAAVAQVTNTGMADAYPIVKIRPTGIGTVRWYQLVNTLTGDGIYLNYALQPGEEVTLTTEPGARSLTSSAFGNIFGKVLPGSNFTGFRLVSGTNYISLFCDSGSVAASIYWTPRGDSVDMGTIY